MTGGAERGILWIISAPSGAGKTSLARALVAATPQLRSSVSYTTRPPRPGEAEGADYHFVSMEAFTAMAERGEFLEYARVHGNGYGTSEPWVKSQLFAGTDCLLEIDWQGARQVRERLPGQAVSIFILPPSVAALAERLRGRGQDSETVIARRLAAAREELLHYDEFDYLVVNDHFQDALADLQSIVHAEHLRLGYQQHAQHQRLKNLLGINS
ncbi:MULTISPECIES: guanylate kinase [Acidithiobacillus]|jgi:guanylate kinase|uniref:Guanylate kinase n=2 Tax=Acidithiobacillus ferrooxidans TaxID=920 RepID=A0A077D113_ACIFR|nr:MULTISPECIES: guanylate kinase [Acidithiobacillus]EGQ62827.1 guanylate kinase [Acidithiobacillus sp. GGI-221]MCL5957112.1 guanylate kinase [Gammaproteobacteria bacterium]ACH82968.1 Guanylate kinase [Acidithiobacillus ferrooxidans ATCC 53993]ACK79498.1 guanylate kinase [Acidithiobacillus ferrooxidans ATCC 23270]AIL25276.1 guanylate kinase [Acidithiobacillus ferrooxidans]